MEEETRHISISTKCSARIIFTGLLFVLALSLPGLAVASHGGSSSPELGVVGHLGAQEMGIPGGENITDVWAYGNYAYLGTFDDVVCSLDFTGIHIVDISDPEQPGKVGFVPAKPGTRNNDVKVEHISTKHFDGEIMVVTNEECGSPFLPRLNSNGLNAGPGRGGIAIWDVSDPTSPRALKQNFLDNGIHNTFIWQDGDNAYLIAVDDVVARDVIVVDITKPNSPKVLAETGWPDWPGLDSSEISAASEFLHDVWVQDNIAYLSYWDAGLVLLDVSDPANPVFLGDSTYPDPDVVSGLPPEGNGHVAAPTADGAIAILGDEDFDKFTTFLVTSEGTFNMGIALFGPDPLTTFPAGPVIDTGGLGCTTSDIPAATASGQIALMERGACFFSTKAANAQAQGYAAYIVYNDAARGDGTTNMSAGTADVITIPGVFIGHSDGLTLAGATNPTVSGISSIFDGEGFMRVLDVSDPGNIVQLGHFATEGVFSLGPVEGDRTAHNVIVDGNRAYWSWYVEGMRVVDFSGCSAGGGFESCTPTEVAHFVDPVGGSNFWGVYLHDHPDGNTYILGSDRNTGLWIFDTP